MELLVLLLILAIAVWAQRAVFRRYAFRNLDYSCTLSKKEAVAGDEIALQEVVSNRKLLPLPWLKSEITTPKWLAFSQLQSVVTDETRFLSSFFMLRSYQRVTRTWEGRCLKRGVFSIQKTVLVAADLLGGGAFSCEGDSGSEVVVFPKPLELDSFFSPVSRSTGDICVRRNLLPDPFFLSGVREYRAGDPLNQIHWAATAREGELMVRQNESSSSRTRTVLLNMQTREFANSGAVNATALENAVRSCAALFEETAGAGIPLRFLANTPSPTATSEIWGENGLHGLMETLARLPLESGEHFPFYLNAIYDQIQTTDLALVTCYLDEAILAFAHGKADAGMRVQLYLLLPQDLPASAEGLDIYMVDAPAPKGGDTQ